MRVWIPVLLVSLAGAPAGSAAAPVEELDRTALRAEAAAAMAKGKELAQRATPEAKREAFATYSRALALWQELDEPREEARALLKLADLQVSFPDRDRAIALYEDALERARAAGAAGIEGWALGGLGLIQWALGEPEEAVDLYAQALPLLRSAGEEEGVRTTLFKLGFACVTLGRWDEAEAALEEVLERARAVRDSSAEAAALHHLGEVAAGRGDRRGAIELYEQALALRRGKPLFEARTLHALGQAHDAMGERETARAHYLRALDLRQEVKDRRGEGETRLGLARLLRDDGDLASARREVEAAIDTLEEYWQGLFDRQSRASFLAANREMFEVYLDILMRLHARQPKNGHDAAALLASEAARARGLLAALAPEEEALAGAIEEGSALSHAGLQAGVLDDQSVLLEYALGRERSLLWIVGRGSLASFELPPRARIEEVARRVHNLLSAGRRRASRVLLERALAELGQMVLAPAAEHLRGRRVLIVPDGVLHYIPFGALPIPGSAEPLLARHEVVLLPSARAAMALRRRGNGQAHRAIAVIADPVFSAADTRVRSGPRTALRETVDGDLVRSAKDAGASLVRLPYSRREADAIARLAPGRAEVAMDFAASRARVMDPRFGESGIAHFATHALVDSRRPELSGLVLSLVDDRGEPQDGFLRLPEISRLELRADLVVLSACETALGREIWGEGLVGLTRAFLIAGASGVVASLWKVDDEATAELMRRFYGAMLGEGLRPAAALRAAQVSMWREPRWRDPQSWAGFILQGDWR